ncbi:MAG: RidA family protein [Rickettsiales bacterium]
MAGKIDARLKELGIELPSANAPAANYVPYVRSGNLLFVSGQTCKNASGMIYSGRVGAERTPEEGVKAARICALNLISQVKEACEGNLDRVRRVVKLTVFVQSVDGFHAQPLIGNGASDVIADIFGDAGRHARAAVGCNALPGGTTVEVEGVFEIE